MKMKKFLSRMFNRTYGFCKGVLTVIILAVVAVCGILTYCAGQVLKENDKSTTKKEG